MIQFFRKIRQRLLVENKLNKYLLYALGEIILVVLGILIALWIDTLNSNKHDRDRAERFVEKLLMQLDNNLEDVNQYIETNEYYYGETERLMPIIGSTNQPVEDAKIDSLVMYNLYDFHLNLDMNTIVEGRENGDLTLVTNDSVSQAIYRYINFYDSILEREQITNLDLSDQFLPYLMENFNLRNLIYRVSEGQGTSPSPLYQGDNSKILTDQEFENLMAKRLSLGNDLLESYIDLKVILLDLKEKAQNSLP